MHSRKFSFFIIILAVHILAGCKAIDLQTINLPLRSTLIKGPAVAENLASMPDDATKTVSALADILIGTPPPANVKIIPSLSKKLRGQAIQENGFALEEARLYQYQISKSGTIRNIEAIADFNNRLGRRYQSRITARYRIDNDHIQILEADAVPYFDISPRTACFIMPAEKLPCRVGNLPHSYEALYRRAAEQALTPQQAASINTPKNWGMAVFYLDRVSSSAKVELGISDTADSNDGYTGESRYLDYNGWRVAFLAGEYTLMDDNPEAPLFLKATYTPGNEAGLLKHSTIVGLYPLTQ